MLICNLVNYRAGTFQNIWDGDYISVHSLLADMANHFNVGLVAVETEYAIDELAQICDGLIIPGSVNNINPLYYGGRPPEPAEQFDEYAFWSKVIAAFAARKKPMFGICGGLQALNVFFGGTLGLVSDLQNEAYKAKGIAHAELGEITDRYGNIVPYNTHIINVEKDSFVYDALQSQRIKINTFHKWAIDRLANDFRAVAYSDDGIIEAIECKEKNIFATQWHPELCYRTGQPLEMEFFKNFIQVCKK